MSVEISGHILVIVKGSFVFVVDVAIYYLDKSRFDSSHEVHSSSASSQEDVRWLVPVFKLFVDNVHDVALALILKT